MEKLYHHPDISGSFIGRHSRRRSDAHSPHTPPTRHSPSIDRSDSDISWRDNVVDVNDHDVDQVLLDIDRFNDAISVSSVDPPAVPDAVETFSKIVESRIVKYYSNNSVTKFGKSSGEDSVFLENLSRLSKLVDGLSNFPASSTTTPCLNRTSMVLHRAMTFLEEEIRDILEEIRTNSSTNSKAALREKQSTVDSDRCVFPEPESKTGEFQTASLETMMMIAKAMISSGYETECSQVFYVARRNALEESMRNLGFEMTGIEEVQRTQLETLESDIATWVKTIKQFAAVIFPAERSLCDAIFSDNRSSAASLYISLAYSVALPLLNFADAVVLTKRSAEKLFKYLDMYDALTDLTTAVKNSFPDSHGEDLISEISGAGHRVAEAAVYIFCDLENSIKGDAAKTPVPGGAVHPLTRYVMNYLKYACEYKDTLEQVFKTHKSLARTISLAKRDEPNGKESPGSSPSSSSPFAVQLMTVMELLDENLEAKSRLYKDISLRYVFLMNNGRYMLQKIKGSAEILQLVGDNWYRMRSTEVRQYHKNYQRETWLKLLKCFSPDGLQVNGKVNKKVVKESFKTFNAMFDEIHKAQSTWVVSDDQLQSELRASISAIVIPAYRSFLGRFRQSLDSGRQSEKYIKYQPEDIETLIDGLFDGNPASMSRRR